MTDTSRKPHTKPKLPRPTKRAAIPPHNIEAEESVLGSVLMSRRALDEVREIITTDAAFYHEQHRVLWRRIAAMNGSPVDTVTLMQALRDAGELEEIGGPAYLHTLVSSVPTSANATHYARIVVSDFRKRSIIDAATTAAQALYDGQEIEDAAESLRAAVEGVEATAERFALVPKDLPALLAKGVPPVAMLAEPYVPAGARIWATGPASSGKSMWALATACRLSTEGWRVVYVSQENPLEVDVSRIARLGADTEYLTFIHDAGLDLILPEHRRALLEHARDKALVVLDTLTAVWSGNEEDNPAIAAFDREVLIPLRDMGVAAIVLDHTGNPSIVKRRGVSAPRGASSKGQKADCLLEFREEKDNGFSIHHAKNRIGGILQAPRQFQITDTEDARLEIVEVERADHQRAEDCAEAMVREINEAGALRSSELEGRVKPQFSRQGDRSAAMALLKSEQPARVVCTKEPITDARGRRNSVWMWRPAEAALLVDAFGGEDTA